MSCPFQPSHWLGRLHLATCYCVNVILSSLICHRVFQVFLVAPSCSSVTVSMWLRSLLRCQRVMLLSVIVFCQHLSRFLLLRLRDFMQSPFCMFSYAWCCSSSPSIVSFFIFSEFFVLMLIVPGFQISVFQHVLILSAYPRFFRLSKCSQTVNISKFSENKIWIISVLSVCLEFFHFASSFRIFFLHYIFSPQSYVQVTSLPLLPLPSLHPRCRPGGGLNQGDSPTHHRRRGGHH